MSYNSAENFASMTDPEFLAKLREATESSDYQRLREEASKKKDESMIQDYLTEKGLWDQFCQVRKEMCSYLENMDDIKYLYVIVLGNKASYRDMYLIDDFDNPLYQTGNYMPRENELYGVDTSQRIEPVVNYSSWGWLCSSYAPVFDKDGKIVCHIGCDIDMEDTITDRIYFLIFIIAGALLITGIVLVISIIYLKKLIFEPLRRVTEESKKFKPAKDVDYDEAGVVRLYLRNQDEINEIYEVIRKEQMNMIDYLNEMAKLEKITEDYLKNLRRAKSDIKDKKKQLGEMEKDNKKYLDTLKEKEEQLGEMSKSVNHDELTHVGSKVAYSKTIEALNEQIAEGTAEFAVAMVDLNDLKKVNDTYGHKSGDAYIKGSCRIISEVFKHSSIFRIGGDEFVVVLTGEDYENREDLVSLAKEQFIKSYFDSKRPVSQRYSASIGLSILSAGDTTFEHVFKRADSEMYAAKMEFKAKYGSYR